jgi:serine/threonine protein kinase
MPIPIGTKLGTHEITALLGKGGMGEVYRALDTRLKREVAIKILPDEFATDADRVSRFQREAEVLASLNHPNIATIHNLEETSGTRYIVLELVGGETLADRIKRSPIPIEEALGIAKQICDALEAAHERGIIHRDLKPANIKLTPDGKVKVLDFGLAKAFQPQPQSSFSNSPTLMGASVPGIILGTAAYMSPEQAKGLEANQTTDIWAFGCVLYEMLTGGGPFDGETLSEVVAGILKGNPDWSRLPPETPENIRRLLYRCLRKERRYRLQHIGDARVEIEEPPNPAAPQVVPKRWDRLALMTVLGIVIGLVVGASIREFRGAAAAAEMSVEVSTPPTGDPASIAISPNGQKIVFVATSEGQAKLWVRPLDSASRRALPGTDGASFPFWSPDNQSVGFFAEGKLKRIDVDRGTVQVLAEAPSGRGGSWNPDGTIIFTPNSVQSPIFRMSATGGSASALSRLEARETSHRFPYFLPDGHHFLYYVQGAPETHGIYVGDLDGSPARRLLDVDSAVVYESSGHLLFVREGTLFAQEFDPAHTVLKGSPFLVAEHIAAFFNAQGSAAISASSVGSIVYRTAPPGGRNQFLWLNRSGMEVGKVGERTDANAFSITLDSRRIALGQLVNNNIDIWLLERGRNVLSKFTFDPAVETSPIWSPNGQQIVFQSNRKGPYDLYIKPANGPGNEELLLGSAEDKRPQDWSTDGRFLLYGERDPKTGYKIWALPMTVAAGDRKPFQVSHTNFEEDLAEFSPDGKWIAYQSNESGRYEIYVQPFPGPGGHIQVSTKGGAQPRWRRDGKELFYIALDGRLMSVPIRVGSKDATIEGDPAVPLFETHVGPAVPYPNNQQYEVSQDGRQFLMNTIIEETPSPITVVLNWKAKP